MKALDTNAILRTLSEVDLDDPGTTFGDVRAATKQLGGFDKGAVTLTRMRGQSPWERHMRGEELFYVISGEVQFRLLAKSAERTVTVPKGSVFIIPRGAWHRSRSKRGTIVLIVRGSEHGPVTFADDPRAVAPGDLIH